MMIKKIIISLVIATISTSAFAFEKLSCSQIYGNWQGNLGNLRNVILTIHPRDAMNEDANISFNDSDNASNEYGLFTGDCKENTDGSVTATYKRNSWGVNGTIDVRLNGAKELIVTNFSYQDYLSSGSGSGVLNK